ncbi:omptin family outer membrane protease [Treponema putidum]|uniref:Omptin family outer membrane protease n=1 Tax=Treponema putidum TaxID=221027 RepID=A0ABY5HTT7_9SPIR|nr:omptin family outer membrane protease [Treponema putidum]UTY28834.1 omptin family outer membrane protease [Treponema putidum]
MRQFNRLIAIFFIFFITAKAISPEEETSFNFSASPCLIIGSGFEYVLKYDITRSRLDWPLLPSGGFTANTEFRFKKGLYLSFFSSFIIPSYSGQIFDYDYLNNSDPFMLTKFSEHKSYIRQGVDLNFNLGWVRSLVIYKTSGNKNIKIYCGPSLGIRYILNSWDAVDGYTKYPPDTEPPSPVLPDTPIVPVSGIGISYKQAFILPYIGMLFRFELPRDWKIDLSTQLCPSAIGFAEDFHYKRDCGGLKFVDVFEKKNISFYLYLSAAKKLSKYFSFFSSVDYTSITAYNGKSFVYFLKSGLLKSYSATGAAGASLHCGRISLGFIFHIIK